MASLAAFPQFGANPVVDRVLGVDKSLQVVWIAHPIFPTEGVSTVMVESRGTRMCDVVFRFARDSPLEGGVTSELVSGIRGSGPHFGILFPR